jgi:hypothetical protein
MSDFKLTSRISCAERYYKALSQFHFESRDEWMTSFNRIVQENQSGLPEMLAMIHPDWYPPLAIIDPRGPRNFPSAEKYAQCRSIEFYGYPCPFKNATIQIDHEFPHSKGGVTNHANAMYLCKEHNVSKFTDIHIISWENINISWVNKLLLTFTHEVSRHSQFKFPEFHKVIERI